MAKRLLVVDDDPGLLLAVSETLRAEGYDVKTARRGAEALIIVAQTLPDLIMNDRHVTLQLSALRHQFDVS